MASLRLRPIPLLPRISWTGFQRLWRPINSLFQAPFSVRTSWMTSCEVSPINGLLQVTFFPGVKWIAIIKSHQQLTACKSLFLQGLHRSVACFKLICSKDLMNISSHQWRSISNLFRIAFPECFQTVWYLFMAYKMNLNYFYLITVQDPTLTSYLSY